MQKNTAGQKWIVFAFQDEGGSNPGEPVTGDAANITANLRLDGGAANAVDDTNPTELEDGYYVFDITQAESNADLILMAPQSSTANVNVIGVPGAVWTTPASFNADIVQTGDSYARLGAPAAASIAADLVVIDNFVDDLESRLSAVRAGYLDNLAAGAVAQASVCTESRLAELDAANLPADVDAILTDTGTTIPAQISGLNDPTALAIADAVWDEAASGHVGAGTFGAQCGTDIDAILADTNELQGDWANGGRLDLILDARAAEATVAALNNISVADILTTQMTESYAADGAAPTIAQALCLIQQMLGDFTISGTTMTIKKVDGSTTAATFTLNDGAAPTGVTRAS